MAKKKRKVRKSSRDRFVDRVSDLDEYEYMSFSTSSKTDKDDEITPNGRSHLQIGQ